MIKWPPYTRLNLFYVKVRANYIFVGHRLSHFIVCPFDGVGEVLKVSDRTREEGGRVIDEGDVLLLALVEDGAGLAPALSAQPPRSGQHGTEKYPVPETFELILPELDFTGDNPPLTGSCCVNICCIPTVP